MEDFKDLVVWTKAHQLTLAVYRRTGAFPKEEMYGSDEPGASRLRFHRCEHR